MGKTFVEDDDSVGSLEHDDAIEISYSWCATQCNQGISIDFGFMVQKSSADSYRVCHLQGLHGKMCYCIIIDHYSGQVIGETFCSKAPPMEFFNHWLALHALPKDVPGKYVPFDNGGELRKCKDIIALFENARYSVEPMAPDSRLIPSEWSW